MPWKSEALLTAIAAAAPRDCITEAQLIALTGYDAKAVENCCHKLRRIGLLQKTARGCHKLTDAGRAAVKAGTTVRSGPRGPQSGVKIVRKETLRSRAWAAMRIRHKASIDDIALLVAQGDERDLQGNIEKYFRALARAGYLRQLTVRESGTAPTSNGFVRYLLINDTGPLAPVWRPSRGSVYDPNTETEQPIKADIAFAPRRKPGNARRPLCG